MKAAEAAGIKAIYKSSFDKANRTSASAKRGVGLEEGIAIRKGEGGIWLSRSYRYS